MSEKRNRKRVWGICVVATVAAIAVLSAGSPVWATAIVNVDELVVDPGGSITSTVTVNGITNLGSGNLAIFFDSTVVEVTGVTGGDMGGVSAGVIDHAGDTDELRLGFTDSFSGHTGDIDIADVTWHAVGSVGDWSVLDLIHPQDLVDYDGYFQISHTVSDGSFSIVPEPSSLVLLASLAVSGGLMFLRRRRR